MLKITLNQRLFSVPYIFLYKNGTKMFLGGSGVIGLLSCTLYQFILCILYNCFHSSPAELPSPFYINKYDKLNGILYAQCAFTE